MKPTIVTDLEKLCDRADEVDIRKEGASLTPIILELKNAVRDNKLAGLAAPQLGYLKRVFVINFNGDVRTFINPIIQEAKGFDLAREQDPSLPGREFLRIRNNNILVAYQTPLGKAMSCRLTGMAAVVYQRLLDILDGMTLADVGLEIDEAYDKASEEERVELINAYLDSLDLAQKKINREIQEDPELRQIKEASDFIESVQQGKTRLTKGVSVDKNGNIIAEETKEKEAK